MMNKVTINLFFDCEFTHIQESAELPVLVSVGIISQDGRTFYAENENVQEELCSEFVIETVLPLLDGGEALITYAQIASRLKTWIESFDGEAKLWSDAPGHDWPHLDHMFSTYGWPSNLRRTPAALRFSSSVQNTRFDAAVEDIFRSTPALRRHHALDDSIANRHAFKMATMRRY
jgi:hypothetical protein